MRLGALEAGGTKMVCVIGDEKGSILKKESFPTLYPEKTIPALIDFFMDESIEALGIGSFGPLCLDRASSRFGSITTTPKPGWQGFALRDVMADALKVPVGIDTDVNAAAIGEAMLGAGKGLDSLVYYTIGTGIGGGAMIDGKPLHGLIHPEMGHMLLRPVSSDPSPKGFCPYHESCLEGLANGPAIEKRWGKSAKELPVEHPAWELEASYLAQMCVNTIVMLSPQMIVLGGGVMHQRQLFPMIHRKTCELLNGYVDHPAILENIEKTIVPPGLGDNAGAVGSLLLAYQEYNR